MKVIFNYFRGATADASSSMNPSAFIQQMARLASPSPLQRYAPPQSHPAFIHAQSGFPCAHPPLANPYSSYPHNGLLF